MVPVSTTNLENTSVSVSFHTEKACGNEDYEETSQGGMTLEVCFSVTFGAGL